MMNSKVRRVLLLAACAVLLVAMSVGATLAYLTANTETVNNTFSVGNVSFDETAGAGLDETDVDVYGVKDSDTRVKANEYKLIPGHSYIKDPTVHIGTDSENAWLFVKVHNGISAVEVAYEYTVVTGTDEDGNPIEETKLGTIADQMTALGWTQVDGAPNGVFAYKEPVTAGQDIPVFKGFKLDGAKDLTAYATATVDVQAYIVQADGFDTAKAAWTAAPLEAWTTGWAN